MNDVLVVVTRRCGVVCGGVMCGVVVRVYDDASGCRMSQRTCRVPTQARSDTALQPEFDANPFVPLLDATSNQMMFCQAAAPKRPSTARTTRVCRRQTAQQKQASPPSRISSEPLQVDHDVSSLRGTLLDEIQILRKYQPAHTLFDPRDRQYREIVTQVTGSGSSGFDSGALNVALRNVIDKVGLVFSTSWLRCLQLERKGEQLQLIDRMERDVSRPTASHHAWLP
mmetsp:Transcript_45636/g.98848  ORF Transcript_45636/g.98848 Transcript_45636/m.98848 type:complete len:226 (-) Transcript_45636:305-982(-)